MTIAEFKENDTIISTQSGCRYKVIKITEDIDRSNKKPVKRRYSIIESENGKYKAKIYHSNKEKYWQLCHNH